MITTNSITGLDSKIDSTYDSSISLINNEGIKMTTKIINGRKMLLVNTYDSIAILEIHLINIVSNWSNIWISRLLNKENIIIGYEVWVR